MGKGNDQVRCSKLCERIFGLCYLHFCCLAFYNRTSVRPFSCFYIAGVFAGIFCQKRSFLTALSFNRTSDLASTIILTLWLAKGNPNTLVSAVSSLAWNCFIILFRFSSLFTSLSLVGVYLYTYVFMWGFADLKELQVLLKAQRKKADATLAERLQTLADYASKLGEGLERENTRLRTNLIRMLR